MIYVFLRSKFGTLQVYQQNQTLTESLLLEQFGFEHILVRPDNGENKV